MPLDPYDIRAHIMDYNDKLRKSKDYIQNGGEPPNDLIKNAEKYQEFDVDCTYEDSPHSDSDDAEFFRSVLEKCKNEQEIYEKLDEHCFDPDYEQPLRIPGDTEAVAELWAFPDAEVFKLNHDDHKDDDYETLCQKLVEVAQATEFGGLGDIVHTSKEMWGDEPSDYDVEVVDHDDDDPLLQLAQHHQYPPDNEVYTGSFPHHSVIGRMSLLGAEDVLNTAKNYIQNGGVLPDDLMEKAEARVNTIKEEENEKLEKKAAEVKRQLAVAALAAKGKLEKELKEIQAAQDALLGQFKPVYTKDTFDDLLVRITMNINEFDSDERAKTWLRTVSVNRTGWPAESKLPEKLTLTLNLVLYYKENKSKPDKKKLRGKSKLDEDLQLLYSTLNDPIKRFLGQSEADQNFDDIIGAKANDSNFRKLQSPTWGIQLWNTTRNVATIGGCPVTDAVINVLLAQAVELSPASKLELSGIVVLVAISNNLRAQLPVWYRVNTQFLVEGLLPYVPAICQYFIFNSYSGKLPQLVHGDMELANSFMRYGMSIAAVAHLLKEQLIPYLQYPEAQGGRIQLNPKLLSTIVTMTAVWFPPGRYYNEKLLPMPGTPMLMLAVIVERYIKKSPWLTVIVIIVAYILIGSIYNMHKEKFKVPTPSITTALAVLGILMLGSYLLSLFTPNTLRIAYDLVVTGYNSIQITERSELPPIQINNTDVSGAVVSDAIWEALRSGIRNIIWDGLPAVLPNVLAANVALLFGVPTFEPDGDVTKVNLPEKILKAASVQFTDTTAATQLYDTIVHVQQTAIGAAVASADYIATRESPAPANNAIAMTVDTVTSISELASNAFALPAFPQLNGNVPGFIKYFMDPAFELLAHFGHQVVEAVASMFKGGAHLLQVRVQDGADAIDNWIKGKFKTMQDVAVTNIRAAVSMIASSTIANYAYVIRYYAQTFGKIMSKNPNNFGVLKKYITTIALLPKTLLDRVLKSEGEAPSPLKNDDTYRYFSDGNHFMALNNDDVDKVKLNKVITRYADYPSGLNRRSIKTKAKENGTFNDFTKAANRAMEDATGAVANITGLLRDSILNPPS